MEKKLEEMSVMELESICYRQLVILETAKNNIQIIQQELQKRNGNSQEIKKEGI
jgi:phosphoribosyl-ATP pyrophosphohydrolase